MQKNLFGSSIEALVCAFLENNELACLQKNFSCRLGEIDLVMFEASSNTLVFVEVRFRASSNRGSATESVDWRKQRKLRRTVLYYLQKYADANQAARIDVVGVTVAGDSLCTTDALVPGVSTHEFQKHYLVWTRNAIEES